MKFSGKFLSLYVGPFSCKVHSLEKDGACLFLLHDFVYSNKLPVDEWLFFTFLSWKSNFFAYEEKISLSEKELLEYHEAVNFCVCREPYQ